MMGNESDSSDQIRREYDWGEVTPAVAITESIAELENGEEAEATSVLDKPLQTYVDVEALNTLVQNENTPFITVRVSYYNIQIRGNSVEVSFIGEN
jgi:hypothetical protein